jgi:hypothetical protein
MLNISLSTKIITGKFNLYDNSYYLCIVIRKMRYGKKNFDRKGMGTDRSHSQLQELTAQSIPTA